MSAPSEQSGSSNPPSGKRKQSASGWATRKARDARRQAEYFEGKQTLESPSYTLGVLDDHQLHVHLAPPVQEKHAATAFERSVCARSGRRRWSCGWTEISRQDTTRHLICGRCTHKGDTRVPDPFLSVTFTIFATTQQRFVLRGKAGVIREVGAPLVATATAQALSASSAHFHSAPQLC